MSFLIFSDGYTEGVMNPHVAKENKFNVMCVLFSRYKCFFSYSHNLLNAHHSILFQLIKNDPLKLLHENENLCIGYDISKVLQKKYWLIIYQF